MELPRLLDELTRAAAKVGVAVRTEPFDPHLSDAGRRRGGLCTVRGRRIILVDAAASLPDQIATIAGALAQVDLEAVYLPPVVRATIGAYGRIDADGPPPRPLRAVPSGPATPRTRRPARPGAVGPPLPLARTRWRDGGGKR